MNKETTNKVLSLKTINKSNVWDIQESDVFRLWEAAEKDADLKDNMRHYIDILKSAFDIEEITVDKPEVIKGKKVLVIEDGPTLTHGEMKIGAGTVAAMKCGAAELIDPRPYTVGELTTTFKRYPNIGTLLPAMGYGEKQMKDLEKTIAKTPCDAVVIGTPIDLQRFIKIKQPCTRVGYELQELGQPTLKEVLDDFIKKHKLVPSAKKAAKKTTTKKK